MPIPLNEKQSKNRPDELKPYDRLKHTDDEARYLRNRGFRPVVSSNVSAVARDDEVLVIRFHGGATYGYPRSGDRYQDLMNAPSKGRWVWNELRRRRVPYYKMGALNIDDDVDDRDMMIAMGETDVDLDTLTTDGYASQTVSIKQAQAQSVIVDIERIPRVNIPRIEIPMPLTADDSIIASLLLAEIINARAV